MEAILVAIFILFFLLIGVGGTILWIWMIIDSKVHIGVTPRAVHDDRGRLLATLVAAGAFTCNNCAKQPLGERAASACHETLQCGVDDSGPSKHVSGDTRIVASARTRPFDTFRPGESRRHAVGGDPVQLRVTAVLPPVHEPVHSELDGDSGLQCLQDAHTEAWIAQGLGTDCTDAAARPRYDGSDGEKSAGDCCTQVVGLEIPCDNRQCHRIDSQKVTGRAMRTDSGRSTRGLDSHCTL